LRLPGLSRLLEMTQRDLRLGFRWNTLQLFPIDQGKSALPLSFFLRAFQRFVCGHLLFRVRVRALCFSSAISLDRRRQRRSYGLMSQNSCCFTLFRVASPRGTGIQPPKGARLAHDLESRFPASQSCKVVFRQPCNGAQSRVSLMPP